MRLKDKVALITGASSGIGLETARIFAEEGASVVVVARRKDRLETLVDHITTAGGRGIAVAGDVTREEDVQGAVDAAVTNYGRLDIVISNAGLMDRMDPVVDLEDDVWNSVIDVNLTGPMRIFRAAIPAMEKNGGGAFVTVSSVGGICGARAGAAYTASKHGVIGLAMNVAYAYARKGIRSNVIAPGGVSTEILAEKDLNKEGEEIYMAGAASNIRMGEPIEVAWLALFLASDEASLVNGAIVTADAGWTAY